MVAATVRFPAMTDAASNADIRTPLRSDPPWLRRGLLGVTLASVLICALYFRYVASSHPPVALSLIPGLAVATFAGSLLAWWGRRRGGTMQLETNAHRLVLQEPQRRQEIVDRGRSFGAMLITDKNSGARALVVSQQGEPTVVYDPEQQASTGSPTAFKNRSVSVDLGHVALSPDSANVITATLGTRIDPVLESLDRSMTDETDWLRYALPSGEVLQLTNDGIRIGDRVATIGKPTIARRIAIQSPSGEIAALSILCEENSFLLACHDPAGSTEGVTPVEAPDVYLPVLVWSVIATRFGVETGPLAAKSGSYRG